MTQLRRRFLGTTVDTAALRAALEAFNRGCGEDTVGRRVLRLSRRNESWELERVDDFLEEYARGPCQALLQEESGEGVFSFRSELVSPTSPELSSRHSPGSTRLGLRLIAAGAFVVLIGCGSSGVT